MKKQQKQQRFGFIRSQWVLPFVVFTSIVTAGSFIVTPFSTSYAADQPQTIDAYCGKYTTNTEKNACKAGVNGQEDCNDYVDSFPETPAIGELCFQAARDRAQNKVTPGALSSPSPSPSPSVSPSPSTGSDGSDLDLSKLEEIIKQAQEDDTMSLSDFIDLLHQGGEDKDVETDEVAAKPGHYVNGAGKQQKIETITPGTGNSPAILFFNGGGWIANDCSGQKVSRGGGEDCTAGGSAPKPSDRGYATFDVTYRLGTSSVYYAFEDVMRGIKHMRENADEYGIDPDRIVIWGDSAGGSLSMRAAASGKSGAKAAVGWSAPTNGYTALFKSFQSFAIGMAHSTCVPTDLAGFANFADLANGGSGEVAEYGMGITSNDFSALGISLGGAGGEMDPLALLTQGLMAGQNLLSAANDVESISSQIQSGNPASMAGSTFNLASKKFVECLDNFNVLSPALFASPDTPPSFLAGFESDGVVDPSQLNGMRDKLRQLGIHSDSLILPGTGDCTSSMNAMGPAGSGGCHLGYWPDFVCETLNFIDSEVQPDRGRTDCETGVAENQGSNESSNNSGSSGGAGGSGSNSGSGSGGSQSGSSNNNSGGSSSNNGTTEPSTTIAQQKAACEREGRTWQATSRGGGYCLRPTQQEATAGYYSPTYVRSGDSGRYTCPKGGTFTQDPQRGNICKI